MRDVPRGLIWANLVDFDALYGHRNNVDGYARNLERFDARLADLLPQLRPTDLLRRHRRPRQRSRRRRAPTIRASTCRCWPSGALVAAGVSLGTRETFADLGQTMADNFGVAPLPRGTSFLEALGDSSLARPSRMNTIRQQLEARERAMLAPQATFSDASQGRARPEAEDPIRPAFQRDRDRVVHSKAFRRLKHKTQVFFSPAGDHYRTRLTHTLEVSQIARTLAKVLNLHEELTEAIALAHDLGHTPFGHAGERVLDKLVPGGFSHATQSLRIVEVLEQGGEGLNLTYEVRQGISTHSKGKHGLPINVPAHERAATLEAQIARVADIIAYVNHDIDDAVRAGVLNPADLPASAVAVLGTSSSARIGAMVTDVVQQSLACDLESLRMSEPVLQALLDLRAFMFAHVYENDVATAEFAKATGILGGLWEKVREQPGHLAGRAHARAGGPGCGRQGLPGRHDRPLRRAPVRGTLHPPALDRGPASVGFCYPCTFARVPRTGAVDVQSW